jgi:dTDP-4-amino-4,6-dideoxygalactose transaminase
MSIPLVRPNPVSLGRLRHELAEIDVTRVYSNYGPVNQRFERAVIAEMFDGVGSCVTVCNATIGLMLAIRNAIETHDPGARTAGRTQRRFALMPSFTFAAMAHAADWCGLTPLLCDIDPDTWLPSAAAESQLLRRYGSEIAVLAPNATFGNSLDLDRYTELSKRYDIPVVVDGAASLGSATADNTAFGKGFAHPVVYSMHATKAFATGEAGLIYCADEQVVKRLRDMGNFGFGEPRTATMPGLNSKLSEVGALLAAAKLREFPAVVDHRMAITNLYRELLPGWKCQTMTVARNAYQFMPVELPKHCAGARDAVIEAMQRHGIGVGRYFSPHLAEQPYFRSRCTTGPLPVTERLAGRIIALPISDTMTSDDVVEVCEQLLAVTDALVPARRKVAASRPTNEHAV